MRNDQLYDKFDLLFAILSDDAIGKDVKFDAWFYAEKLYMNYPSYKNVREDYGVKMCQKLNSVLEDTIAKYYKKR